MSDGSNYLDPNRPDAVRLSVSDARALGEAALGRIITDQLIDNSLCGYRFAGLPRILAIAREARTRNARVPVAVVHETPVSALVDGGNNVGYVAVYRGAEIAIAKAKQSGVAAVGVYNSYFSGRNAYYLERIVDAGLVGLHTASGSPHIVPPGATRPALGTNRRSVAAGPGVRRRREPHPRRTRRGAGSPPLADIKATGWLSRSRPWACSPARRSRAAACRITGFCFWLSIPGRFCPGTRSRSRCPSW